MTVSRAAWLAFVIVSSFASCTKREDPAVTPGDSRKETPGDTKTLEVLRAEFDACMRAVSQRRRRGESPMAADVAKIEAAWLDLMKLDAKQAEPCWRLARLYAAVESHRSALEMASKALERQPRCIEAAVEINLVFLRLCWQGSLLTLAVPMAPADWFFFPKRLLVWNGYYLDLPQTPSEPVLTRDPALAGRLPLSVQGTDEEVVIFAGTNYAMAGGASRMQLDALARLADSGTERIEVYEVLACLASASSRESQRIRYAEKALALNPRSILGLLTRAEATGQSISDLANRGTPPAPERLSEFIRDIDRALEIVPERADLRVARAKAGAILSRLLWRAGKSLGDEPWKTLDAWGAALKADRTPDRLYGHAAAWMACALADHAAGRDPSKALAAAEKEFRELAALHPRKRYIEMAIADTLLLAALWMQDRHAGNFPLAIKEYDRLDFLPCRESRLLAILEWGAYLERSSLDPKPARDRLLTADQHVADIDLALRCIETCVRIGDEILPNAKAKARDWYDQACRFCGQVGQLDRTRLREMQERSQELRRRGQ